MKSTKSTKSIISKILVSILSVTLVSGCLSNKVFQGSKKKIALRKAILQNNQPAIQAIRLGEDAVGFGVDVTNLEALKEEPLKQIGAALGDAAIIWGTYEGVRWGADQLNDDGDKAVEAKPEGGGNNTSGRDTIVINGDGNTVDTSSDNSSGIPEGL